MPRDFTPIIREGQKGRAALPRVIDTRIIENEHGCWVWQSKLSSGNLSPHYGSVWWSGKAHPAHRFVYERLVEDIPAGLILDHLCMVKPCVNPEHLEAIKQGENVRRGAYAARLNRECQSQSVLSMVLDAERVGNRKGE